MCLSLAAFNAAPARRGAAGAHPRPALRRQDLPRLLRGPLRRSPATPATIPVLTVDGPTASARARSPPRSPPRSATACSTRARSIPRRLSRRSHAGVDPDDEATLAGARRAASTCASTPGASSSAAPTSATPCAWRTSARSPRALGLAARARRPPRPPALRSAPCPGWSPTARHGDGRLPGRGAEGVSHRGRRRARRAPPQAIDCKGNSR